MLNICVIVIGFILCFILLFMALHYVNYPLLNRETNSKKRVLRPKVVICISISIVFIILTSIIFGYIGGYYRCYYKDFIDYKIFDSSLVESGMPFDIVETRLKDGSNTHKDNVEFVVRENTGTVLIDSSKVTVEIKSKAELAKKILVDEFLLCETNYYDEVNIIDAKNKFIYTFSKEDINGVNLVDKDNYYILYAKDKEYTVVRGKNKYKVYNTCILSNQVK